MKGLIHRAAALGLCLALLSGAHAATLPEDAAVWGYSEGLALCEQNGKWGYVDARQEIVIPIQYDSAVSFSLGLARVSLRHKLGIIRPDGTYLLPPEYDSLLPVDCGLYIAQQGVLWGVVSILPLPNGAGGQTNALFPLEYDSVRLETLNGTERLVLQQGEARTVIPVSSLPALLAERRAPAFQFQLSKNRTAVFSDVSPRDWFALWVNLSYNVGLMEGAGDGQFEPLRTLTVAEALRLAACLESRALQDDFHLRTTSSTPWYSASVAYCEATGIITHSQFSAADFERPVTRAEMAQIFAATTPVRAAPECNSSALVRQMIPDVKEGDFAAAAIFSLYAKGLLTGTDSALSFRPESSLTRPRPPLSSPASPGRSSA